MNQDELHPNFLRIAFVGNPNSGKTTLFNRLTGLKQKTGNYSGVTVEKNSAELYVPFSKVNTKIHLIDLPGTNSLLAKSDDEKITCDILNNPKHEDHPHLVLFVADIFNLKQSLYFLQQILEKKIPTILILTFTDEFYKKNHQLNSQQLSDVFKIPVIEYSKNDQKIPQKIWETLNTYYINQPEKKFLEIPNSILAKYELAGKLLIQSNYNISDTSSQKSFIKWFDFISTHKIWGIVLFVSIMFLVFQSVFWIADIPMQWIESIFSYSSEYLSQILPQHIVSRFFSDGIINGIGGVVIFIPQIFTLFFLIQFLEHSGYMPRVSFLLEKIMQFFGLSGKSVIPLINGYACAVPAIMATKTIPNNKERFISIFILPFITCSARLPVYTLLISLIYIDSNSTFWGWKGLLLTAMYLLGLMVSLLASIILSKLLPKTEKRPFIMEIPKYIFPDIKAIAIQSILKVKIFLWEAGKVILIASIILWILGNINPSTFSENPTETTLENSFLGTIGKSIEPAIRPLGYNWKIGIAIISSFAAREVFVGTMATIYSMEENSGSLREILALEVDEQTGIKSYSIATCVSLLLFYAFALQCMSTMAVVYRELRSVFWVTIQFVSMFVLAYISAFLAYQILI